MERENIGNLIVISGPSGVGKGTVCRSLLKKIEVVYSISATTRRKRPGEIQGKDYFYYTRVEFEKKINEDAFLEWARVYGNYYGTPIEFVDQILHEGKDCILEIDTQGALQVKEKRPEAIFIFILPPSKEELIRRLTGRGTENEKEINTRIGKLEEELAHLCDYDYKIINDNIEIAAEKIKAIIVAERCRVKKNK